MYVCKNLYAWQILPGLPHAFWSKLLLCRPRKDNDFDFLNMILYVSPAYFMNKYTQEFSTNRKAYSVMNGRLPSINQHPLTSNWLTSPCITCVSVHYTGKRWGFHNGLIAPMQWPRNCESKQTCPSQSNECFFLRCTQACFNHTEATGKRKLLWRKPMTFRWWRRSGHKLSLKFTKWIHSRAVWSILSFDTHFHHM